MEGKTIRDAVFENSVNEATPLVVHEAGAVWQPIFPVALIKLVSQTLHAFELPKPVRSITFPLAAVTNLRLPNTGLEILSAEGNRPSVVALAICPTVNQVPFVDRAARVLNLTFALCLAVCEAACYPHTFLCQVSNVF